MAAISLGLVGHGAIGERLGRNARFAAVGNGLAAAVMGATGYVLSARAVFFATAALLGPALLALRWISSREIDPKRVQRRRSPQEACMHRIPERAIRKPRGASPDRAH
jgi:hypothetical protein